MNLVVALEPAPWTQVREEWKRLRLEQNTLSRIVEAVTD